MSLNKKTFIFITSLIATTMLGVIITSRVIILEGYLDLERKQLERNLDRTLFTIKSIVSDLETFNRDWANWDDAYTFVQDKNQDFINSSLNDESFINARINLIVFLDNEGKIVFSKAFDLNSQKEIPISDSLKVHLVRQDLLITHIGKDSIGGIIKLDEGLLKVSSHPIFKSDGSGPSRGTLVMSRFLDKNTIEKISNIVQLPVSFVNIEDSRFKPDDYADDELIVGDISDEKIIGYKKLLDIYNEPVNLVAVEMPRESYAQAIGTLGYFLIATLLIGSIVITGGIYFQNKSVLAPIYRLTEDLNKIKLTRDLSSRVTITGKDEIGRLADDINNMLNSLQEFNQEIYETDVRLKEKLDVIENQNIELEKTKTAMMNLLEDERELEESLRLSEASLQNAQRIAHLGSWDWDIIENKLVWSDEIYRIFGVAPQEFKASYEGFLSYVHPEDRKNVDKEVQESLKNKTPYSIEHRVVLADGSVRVVHERGEAKYDNLGKPVRMIGTVLDITERKILEDLLKKEHDRLDLIISSMGEGLLVIDENYKITMINPVAQNLLKVKAADVIGKKWSEIATTLKNHKETPIEERSFARAVKEGKTTITSLDDNHWYKTKSGKVFPIISITVPLKVEGKIVGAVKVFRDATSERKSRELIEKEVADRTLELWEERARMFASINSLQMGFIIADKNHNIIVKNPAVSDLLKIEENDITFAKISEALSANLDLKALGDKCLQEKTSFAKDDIYFKDKFLRVFLTPVMPKDAATAIGYVLLIEDVTTAKQLERAKDEFFAVASHELRTPLTAIRGNTSLIMDYFADKIQDQDLKEMVSDMHESSIRLINIVNDFLDASRLEQGKIEFKKEEFDIRELMKGVVDELDDFAKQKGLFVKVVEDSTPIKVYADKARTQQVGNNLLGNAIKFTKTGGVTISFEINENFARVRVSDTGVGILPGNQGLLFKKFQQAGERVLARDVTKGTGMGLYISKLLTEGMGGKIYLEKSELGKGSTFSFELPLATRL